ncbi:unnamed protein product [Amoebophrya sp. A120]|nr:unnamed protein product [Amoebophrya sp. A120]|eukprot:GSA120T00016308001.1
MNRLSRPRLKYFELLDLPEDCTTEQVVRQFRRKSLRVHPDKPTGDKEQFQQLNRAYTCLRDERRRAKYLEDGFDDQHVSTEESDTFVDAFFGEGARASTGHSADFKLYSVSNYQTVNLSKLFGRGSTKKGEDEPADDEQESGEPELPVYMRDIIKVGLNYLASLEDHEFANIFFLRHMRIDILYLMIGVVDENVEPESELYRGAGSTSSPVQHHASAQEQAGRDASSASSACDYLTQEMFERDSSYPITYYDTPLQPGIAPRWSDQNILASCEKIREMNEKKAAGKVERRELSFEEFERRQRYALAALEYQVDELGVLEDEYEAKLKKQLREEQPETTAPNLPGRPATPPAIPGSTKIEGSTTRAPASSSSSANQDYGTGELPETTSATTDHLQAAQAKRTGAAVAKLDMYQEDVEADYQ